MREMESFFALLSDVYGVRIDDRTSADDAMRRINTMLCALNEGERS